MCANRNTTYLVKWARMKRTILSGSHANNSHFIKFKFSAVKIFLMTGFHKSFIDSTYYTDKIVNLCHIDKKNYVLKSIASAARHVYSRAMVLFFHSSLILLSHLYYKTHVFHAVHSYRIHQTRTQFFSSLFLSHTNHFAHLYYGSFAWIRPDRLIQLVNLV